MARYALAMTRFISDQNGRAIAGATVTVYVQETGALATIYAAQSGGSAIDGSVVTTDDEGYYIFFVDDEDYGLTTHFKLVVTKAGYDTKTLEWVR
jgi:hypothetical protein